MPRNNLWFPNPLYVSYPSGNAAVVHPSVLADCGKELVDLLAG